MIMLFVFLSSCPAMPVESIPIHHACGWLRFHKLDLELQFGWQPDVIGI
jgi:hypothetical protein